jgi:hypothetical protein
VPDPLAGLITGALALYLVVGALFAVPFALWWAGRLDSAAALLWPLLVRRLVRRT